MFCLRPFIFVRHGATVWNHENRLIGQQDIPLCEEGCAQVLRATEILKFLKMRMIVHSPLRRCTQTAQILNQELQLPAFTHEGLMEADLGNYQGQLKTDQSSFQLWKQDPAPQTGESYQQFQYRVLESLEDIFTIAQRGLVLVVAHGGVFEAIREAFQMPEFYLPCATPVVVYPRLKAVVLEKGPNKFP